MKRYLLMGLLALFSLAALFLLKPKKTTVTGLERPDYGEGDQTYTLEATLEEEGASYAESMVLTIPQKSGDPRWIQERLALAKAYVEKTYHLLAIESDLVFPGSYEGIALRFESRSPSLIQSSGKLLIQPGDVRVPLCFHFRAILEGESLEGNFILHLRPLQECAPDTKLRLVLSNLKAGGYTWEEAVLLPGRIGEGELSFSQSSPDRRGGAVLVCLTLMLLCWKLPGAMAREKAKKEEKKALREYPRFLRELLLYLGAGLSLESAFRGIESQFLEKTPLGKEVQLLNQDLREGHSIREALLLMEERSTLPELRRFSSLVIQSLRQGEGELLARLREMAQDTFEARRKEAKKRSEEAETKLLFPMMLMLFSVLLLVLAPALLSI